MKLLVNGSSSAGNSYVMTDSEGRMLLLELGLSEKVIKRSIGFNIPNVDCCVVSHSHGDHARALKDVLKWGKPIIGPSQLFDGLEDRAKRFAVAARHNAWVQYGRWRIMPLAVKHDVPCYAYIIGHREMGYTLFVTDTAEINETINGLNHIMIEANYDERLLQDAFYDGLIDKGGMNRVRESHMCINETIRFLRGTDLSEVNEIVLVHTSARHSDYSNFKETIECEFGKITHIASEGLEIDFNKEMF